MILKAADIDRTIEWYTAAGFEVRGRHTADDHDWCEVARDGTIIDAGATPWEGPPGMTGCVYVPVDDAFRALSALRALVAALGVEERDWGATEVVLQDPDGYFITLTAPH